MRVPRSISALLLPLLVVVASVATASPASAGSGDIAKPVGVGVNRLAAVVSWSDNRPSLPTGRPYRVSLVDQTPDDCGSSRVTSVWVRRIQAGTENILASGVLTNWNPCSSNSQWFLDDSGIYGVQTVTGHFETSYNLWSGPGGSPSPTNKQELRIYLFDSSGHQVDGTVGYPYPG